MAFPPPSSIALTTSEAALASLAYVKATFAPSAARRFAIAAPIPREPPVTSATLSVNLDIDLLWFFHFPPITTDCDLAGSCQTSYLMRRFCDGFGTLRNTSYAKEECVVSKRKKP